MKPFKIGITGGIGSGKSVVCHLFEIMDIPIYNSDMQAKKLTVTDAVIRQELVALVGAEVYHNGILNKSLLTSYLFSDHDHVLGVNHIIHPRVKEDFRQWVLKHNTFPVVGLESAILFEAGFADTVDITVMVEAPENVRIERAIARDAVPKELILQRMRHQMAEEEKKRQSHFVIKNDEENLLIPQILEFIKTLPL